MYANKFPKIPLGGEICKTSRNVFFVRKIEPEVTRIHDTTQLSLQMQLKPAWLVLKALGLLPITLPQPKEDSRAKTIVHFALQVAYPAGVNLTAAIFLCQTASVLGKEFSQNLMSTSRLVYLSIYSIFLIPLGLIAPLHWARMGHILRYTKDWEKLQARFLMVTRHPVRLNMRRQTTVVISVVSVASVVGCLAIHSSPVSRGILVVPLVYSYTMIQINLFLIIWVLLCLAHVKAADQLGKWLREEVRKPGGIGKHVVHDYHRCWLRLNKLTSDIGTMFCLVFNVMLIVWLTAMLLCAFQIATLWANDCSMFPILKLIGFVSFALGSIQVFCHYASLATEAVCVNFKNNLIEIEVDNSEIQKQLEFFEISVGVHSAGINLGGYINVNRSLVVSIMSAFATFLVVLFQSIKASDTDVCGLGNKGATA